MHGPPSKTAPTTSMSDIANAAEAGSESQAIMSNTEANRLEEFLQVLQRPDRTGRPKYQRLADTLVEAMRGGVWQPGDRLPAEEELTQLTPFSLGTVQRALRDLAAQGLVIRQHGLGSFVADPPRELQDPWHCRFLDDDGETLLPIYSQAVARVTVSEPGPWSRHLGPQSQVMRLDRVIIVNDEFRIFSRFYGDRRVLARLWEMPMEELHGTNFKKVIVQQCQLPITDITHVVRTAEFDEESCARIGVEPGTSGMFMHAVACAGRERCVYYQEFYIAPNTRALQFPEASVSSI